MDKKSPKQHNKCQIYKTNSLQKKPQTPIHLSRTNTAK